MAMSATSGEAAETLIRCDYARARRLWGARIANEIWGGLGRHKNRVDTANTEAVVTAGEFERLRWQPGPGFAAVMADRIVRRTIELERE